MPRSPSPRRNGDVEAGEKEPLTGGKRARDVSSKKRGAGKSAAPAAPFKLAVMPPCTVLINPFAWLLWILDFLVFLITLIFPLLACRYCCRRCCKSSSYSDPDEEEDHTVRRREKENWDKEEEEGGLLFAPEKDGEYLRTSWEIAQASFEEFADGNCMGTREYLGMTDAEDGKPAKKILGETTWQSYEEVGENAVNFGAGLRVLGLQPLPPTAALEQTTAPHTMLIFEETCAQWMTSLVGAHSQSLVVATSYATLGIDSVVGSIKECNVSVVLCNRKKVSLLASKAPPCLKAIIYTDLVCTAEECALPPQTGNQIRAYSFDEVVNLGSSQLLQYPVTPPTPEQIAVIMYTSGSTGKPKGVMITHSNIAASAAALQGGFSELKPGQETYLAYLPAAHILELCAELTMLSIGAAIGYADVKTLTDKGCVRDTEDGLNETNDEAPYPGAIMEFAPTMMAGVPVIWDTVKKGVEDQIAKQSCVLRFLIQVAYSGNYLARSQGRRAVLLKLILNAFYKKVGGKLKIGITGGGPISAEVQNFLSTLMGFPLIQGYALTETCCAGTVQCGDDPDTGAVGGPVGSVEIMLRTCAPGGGDEAPPKDREGKYYKGTDTTHYGTKCQGRGEVLIRGPSVSLGYFKQPDKTAEAFDPDGWFHSGDIGLWDARGRLVIVDRLKNLVKLKGGEYIAIESMEKEYATSNFVRGGADGGIMCYGDGDMMRPVALVQVNVPPLMQWAQANGLGSSNVDDVCDDPKAQKMVLESLNAAAKGKLGGNEKLVAVALISGTGSATEPEPMSPWTPENGCRTASNKLERKNIQKTHEHLLADAKVREASGGK